jgi:hypothetical protein
MHCPASGLDRGARVVSFLKLFLLDLGLWVLVVLL